MGLSVSGGALQFEAILTDEQFEAGLQRIEKQLKSLTQTANQEASAIENIASKAAFALGSYLSLNAAKNFISEIVNVRGQYEQLSVSFRTMLGNKEKADALMAQAVQLAATTPFSLLDVATGAKQLLAYGTAAEKIPDTLKTLGNVAAGVSAPLGDLVYLYGTLQTQGRAYTRDILQFTSRGIPIIGELAKQFNVTTAEVQQLVEAGKVGFPEVQKAFQAMTGAGGQFFNLMEEQSKTVTGQISNLGDSFNNMLNEIGASNQGIIVNSIAGLKTLIDNYQTVIDTIKVLVATYGAYKAAVIATTAYNAIAAETVAGYTLVEQLRYRAMLLSEGAMRLLNKTMLSNPYVAVAAGVAALVAAFIVFRKETDQVKTSQQLLADAQQNVGDRLAETEAKILPYLQALKNANISEQERLDIYNKLKAIDPEIVKGLDAKTLSYDKLAINVNKYLDALRNQIAVETNSKAITASIKQEQDLAAQILATNKRIAELQKERITAKPGEQRGYLDLQIEQQKRQNAALQKQADEQNNITKSLGDSQFDLTKKTEAATAAQKRTVDVIDAQISELKKQQTAVSDTSAEYKKFGEQIAALQKEREGITGPSQKALKAEQAEENKINAILNEREGILNRLAGLQRDSKQSGLLQNESEVDKIHEKYDQAFQAIDDYNKKVTEFNKKNGTKVKGIGLTDVDALKNNEAVEIANTQYKQDAANYIAALDDRKKAFEDFRRIQLEGNEDITGNAKDLYKEQLGGFTSYIDYLKTEAAKISIKISVGTPNVGDLQKLQSVNKLIISEQNKIDAENLAHQQKVFADAYTATQNYNNKRQAIDKDYLEKKAALQKFYSGSELAQRLAELDRSRIVAVDAAKDEAVEKTEIYRKLGEDIIQLNRKQLFAQIADVKRLLANVNIEPETKAKLQKELEDLNKSLTISSNTSFVQKLEQRRKDIDAQLLDANLSEQKIKELLQRKAENDKLLSEALTFPFTNAAQIIGDIGNSLSGLADSVSPFNESLGESVKLLSQIADQTSKALSDTISNVKGAISGDTKSIISLFTSQLSAITKSIGNLQNGDFAQAALRAGGGPLGGIVADAIDASQKSAKEAADQIKKYQDSLITGEISYNELLRERARNQQDINDLTTDELRTRQAMLDLQKQQAQADYDRLLKQIQDSGKQVTAETTEKTGGILGIGRKTKVVQELADLGSTDFDTLEKLFTEGKLDEGTAAWYQELKTAHDELDAIGQSAEDVRDRLNEVLTGTTADNIADSITSGLEKGYDSFADFSDDINSLLKKAILSAFSASVVGPAAKGLYDQLAAFNSDGVFTQQEIDDFKRISQSTIENITTQFDQIKQLNNLDFGTSDDSANSLQGAIKGMTEQTAELLAGQLGGVRLNTAQYIQIGTQQLNQLVLITGYTADIPNMKTILSDIQLRGVKIRP